MSISASIDVQLVENNNLSAIDIITTLLSNGWTMQDAETEKATYLPIGDVDFIWQSEDLLFDEISSIINTKEENNETIGIVLTWKDTQIGGNLLMFSENEFSFCITINRRYIEFDGTIRLIDVNWYIEKIIPCFITKPFQIQAFTYEEIRL